MSTTTTTPELISREDAALLAGCSVDTIKRLVISENLETATGLRGKVMVQVADLVRLGRINAPATSTGGSGADSAALLRTLQQLDQVRADEAHLAGRLQERDTLAEVLRQQVIEQARQIRNLHDIIARLVAAPARATS